MFNIKQLLPKKLLARLLIIFFLPLICIQFLAVFLFYDRHWEKITTRFANIASNQINLVIEDYINGREKSIILATNLNIKIDFKDNDFFSSIEDSSLTFVQKNIINTLKGRINREIKVIFDADEVLVFIPMMKEVIELSFPRKYLISETPIILFLWIISSSIILSLIAFLFLRIQVRAITRLAKFSEEFGIGKEVQKFKPAGAVEIRMAGNAFIKMKKRIKNQINSRADFLAGISHDLGTVLTRIKLQLELITKVSEVKDIKEDVNSMQTLLGEYLEYSKNNKRTEKTKRIRLKYFLSGIISKSKKNFIEKDIKLICDSNLNISAKKNSLYRVFSNILDNACKFGDKILVDVINNQKNIHIKVEDDGPGIPANIKKKIFNPFFKIDSSRNLNYVGSGLGLSIASEIVRQIGGRIEVEKSKLGGSCFHIIIPYS